MAGLGLGVLVGLQVIAGAKLGVHVLSTALQVRHL